MLTDRGLCYTFNSDSMEKLYRKTDYIITVKKHLTDWQANKHDKIGNLKNPKMMSSTGVSFRLMLDTQMLRYV